MVLIRYVSAMDDVFKGGFKKANGCVFRERLKSQYHFISTFAIQSHKNTCLHLIYDS